MNKSEEYKDLIYQILRERKRFDEVEKTPDHTRQKVIEYEVEFL